ncbi:MAG: HAD family hydrolase [Armatimonadota bacterium]|nr:HAD family hydrolase [Armatimonadota bacterium]
MSARAGRYRLVVADIDGTLVTSQRTITARVRRAVRQAQRRGVRVCLATGRTWRSARRYFQTLGADPPAILYNGGLIYDFARERVIYRRPMSLRQAQRVIRALDAFPDLAAHYYVNEGIYVRWHTPLVLATARQDHILPQAVGDFRRLRGQPMKFRILGPRPRLVALARRVRRAGAPGTLVFSGPTSLEVLPPGVSKGAAVRRVARLLGVPPRQVIAVGDELNDLSMLQVAGCGVAMGSAPRELRRVADYVAPSSDQDGLAEVIHRFVLTEETDDLPGAVRPGHRQKRRGA